MANNLSTEKKVQIVSSLAENASICGIERMTNVHRDTIMRLGLRVGKACQAIMDQKMHGLSCNDFQCDEIWAYIGKKNKNVPLRVLEWVNWGHFWARERVKTSRGRELGARSSPPC